MTNNTHSVTIDVTYDSNTSESAAAFDTIEWATKVASSARMGTHVVDVKVRDIAVPDRPVGFTFEETERILTFLRKFEASTEAVELLRVIGMRKVYAIAGEDFEDQDNDEPRGVRFGDVKSQPVLSATMDTHGDLRTTNDSVTRTVDLSEKEKEVLSIVAELQKTTFDGYLRVQDHQAATAAVLYSRGLLERKPTFLPSNIYRTSVSAQFVIRALADDK